jgi:tyrosinase
MVASAERGTSWPQNATVLMALAKLSSTAQAPTPSAYQTLRNMRVLGQWEEHSGPSSCRHRTICSTSSVSSDDRSVRVDAPWLHESTNVFSKRFMGRTKRSPKRPVTLDPAIPSSAGSPAVPGILRSATFNTLTQPHRASPGFELLNQDDTLALGTTYSGFSDMEGTPHGTAHVSFNGWISSIPTA